MTSAKPPPIIIVDYQKQWPAEFLVLAKALRKSVGETALRIDHIGSTAVPGLAAKDIIDIQVTVGDLAVSGLATALAHTGAAEIENAEDHVPPGLTVNVEQLQKRLFVMRSPERASNIHVRVAGRFNQTYPLLCRDYLRAHHLAAAAYGEIKTQLARQVFDDADAYYEVKDPVFDLIMAAARGWAESTNWELGDSDA
jgi:GrpB-like predicted nucleotidyltransferase (UPF0157 family)